MAPGEAAHTRPAEGEAVREAEAGRNSSKRQDRWPAALPREEILSILSRNHLLGLMLPHLFIERNGIACRSLISPPPPKEEMGRKGLAGT